MALSDEGGGGGGNSDVANLRGWSSKISYRLSQKREEGRSRQNIVNEEIQEWEGLKRFMRVW